MTDGDGLSVSGPMGSFEIAGNGGVIGNLHDRHERATRETLLFFDIAENGIQVVIETGGVLIADSPHFFDDGVVHGFPKMDDRSHCPPLCNGGVIGKSLVVVKVEDFIFFIVNISPEIGNLADARFC